MTVRRRDGPRRRRSRAVVAGQPGLRGLAGLAAASLTRLREDASLRASLASWSAAGLVLGVAFAAGVGSVHSRAAGVVAGLAALGWWTAVTVTLVVVASLLVTPDGAPVSRLGPANGLTAMRAHSCAGLATCAFVSTPHRIGFILWGTVGTVAAGLDWIDGYVARRFGPVTRMGQAMDPVMDCVFFSMAALGNVALGIVPPWLGALILSRYLLPLVIASAALLSGIRPQLTSTIWGRVNTALTGLVLAVLYPLRAFGGPVGAVALAMGIPLLGTTTVIHWVVLLRRRRDAPVARAAS